MQRICEIIFRMSDDARILADRNFVLVLTSKIIFSSVYLKVLSPSMSSRGHSASSVGLRERSLKKEV